MKLTLEKSPTAKARHRYRKMGTKIVTFDPQKLQKLKDKWDLATQMREKQAEMLVDGPILVKLINYVPIPKSYAQKRCILLEGQYCTCKPDVDNYLKFYLDVLSGIAYKDDRQVACIFTEKIYSSKPRIEIIIEPLGARRV